MLNREKYAKEILEIICSGESVGKQNSHLCPCANIKCSDCEFHKYNTHCNKEFAEWANSEYKEREIDWNKVPVDTPLVILNSDRKVIYRHFAFVHHDLEDMICVYENGKTSFSDHYEDNIECYFKNNVTFKKGVDCSEWYKD